MTRINRTGEMPNPDRPAISNGVAPLVPACCFLKSSTRKASTALRAASFENRGDPPILSRSQRSVDLRNDEKREIHESNSADRCVLSWISPLSWFISSEATVWQSQNDRVHNLQTPRAWLACPLDAQRTGDCFDSKRIASAVPLRSRR